MDERIVKLKNGEQALIRDVLPSDKKFLKEGIRTLSSETVQHRFFLAKKDFSDQELVKLTEFDPKVHFAVGALKYPEANEGYGIARFNLDEQDPSTAEFALLIVDKMQGQGLGKILMEVLFEEARRRGLTSLYGFLQSSNQKMINLGHALKNAKLEPSEQGILKIVILL